MRKRVFKFLKIALGLFLLALTLVLIALFWPMPELKTPKRHDIIVLTSINLIDVKSGSIWEDRNVLIKDNLIFSTDAGNTFEQYPNALVINCSGKFLIPGLWDMHTHSNQHSEWLHHPLFIANGVTGIRDMSGQLDREDSYWAGSKERLLWNAEMEEDKRVMPRYVLQSSYQIDGASSVPSGFPEFFKLQKAGDVDALLDFYKAEDVDFIKVYQQIVPEYYKELALKAPKYGLHIAGHKPVFTSLEDAILLGQRSFEHGRIFMFEAFPKADSLRISKDWKKLYYKSKKSMVEDFDFGVARDLMRLMKEHNAHWVPTLQTLKFEAYAHRPIFRKHPNLDYVTFIRKKLWWDIDRKNNSERNLSQDNKGLSLDFYEASREQVKMAKEIGVPIMVGTDVTDSYVFAGFSLHDELKDLTESGLTPLEALQSATIVPARFSEMDDTYGSVEKGKIADLVILNKNPLENIAHSRSIAGVVMNGIYYDTDKIQDLKSFTKSVADDFHVNVKVIFSLLNSPLMRVQFAD
ncbi:amidohydrolase family protein [Spongiimicrobium salis]|uniref:amidohydrolase family protein n=1 Tax=Spongiimicrobium salis TaxID=1667022 RepID=UPI00374C9B55